MHNRPHIACTVFSEFEPLSFKVSRQTGSGGFQGGDAPAPLGLLGCTLPAGAQSPASRSVSRSGELSPGRRPRTPPSGAGRAPPNQHRDPQRAPICSPPIVALSRQQHVIRAEANLPTADPKVQQIVLIFVFSYFFRHICTAWRNVHRPTDCVIKFIVHDSTQPA